MKNFMKSHLLVCFGALLLSLCLFTGGLCYSLMDNLLAKREAVSSLPWTMALTDEYRSLSPSDKDGIFIAEFWEDDNGINRSCELDPFGRKRSEEIWEEGSSDTVPKPYKDMGFSYVDPFTDGYAVAVKDDRSMIIDERGKSCFTAEYGDSIYPIDGTVYFIDAHENTIFDAKTKNTATVSDDIQFIGTAPGGYYADLISGGYTFLTEDFKIREDGRVYEKFGVPSQGLWYVEREIKTTTSAQERQTEKGYMDEHGKMVIALPEDTLYGFAFSEDKAIVIRRSCVEGYDKKGKQLFSVEANFSAEDSFIFGLGSGSATRYVNDVLTGHTYVEGFNASEILRFESGYAPIVCKDPDDKDGKYGVIDAKGNMVIDPLFDSLAPAGDGFMAAEYQEKYGILDVKEAR